MEQALMNSIPIPIPIFGLSPSYAGQAKAAPFIQGRLEYSRVLPYSTPQMNAFVYYLIPRPSEKAAI
jgi:hypothetical protein